MSEELENAAETVVSDCMSITKNEDVLVLCNDETYSVGKSIYRASKSITEESSLVVYPTADNHGEEPPEFISRRMASADVIIAPTEKSLSHTDARRNATRDGARAATLPGIEEDNFILGMNAEYEYIAERTNKLKRTLDDCENLRVTTPNGTDVTFDIETNWHPDTGTSKQPKDFTNLPAGEVYTTPKNANGVIYIDGTVRPHGVVEDKIRVDIDDGFVTEIHDDQLASKFKELEHKHGQDVYNVAEIAVGTNDGVNELTGSVLLDEKSYGTAHFAIGDDSSMGGDVSVPIHEDAVLKNPTIYVDGEQIEIPE